MTRIETFMTLVVLDSFSGFANVYGMYLQLSGFIMSVKHVGAKPHVRPHPTNTPKECRILVIRGEMKTLAIRRDFHCCFLGFRVSIWGLGFRLLGF